MKKDIIVPPSQGVHLAIVKGDDHFWDLYLLNKNQTALRNIIINTNAKSDTKETSTLRYFLEKMDEFSYIKFESVLDEVVELDNGIMVTYFIGADIYEKEFGFTKEILFAFPPQEIDMLKMVGYEFC
jgi:hypothetical protein